MSKLEKLKDIPIGTKIELSVIDPIEGKINIGFVSQIESYIDENTIRIAAPIFEAKIYPVRINSHIEAYLFFKSNQVYYIIGFVVDRLIVDDIALLEIRLTENIRKMQRRQYFRFKCSVPITFYIKPEIDEEDIVEIVGQTIDLSGGGLSSLTDKPLSDNAEIEAKLELDDENFVVINGKVIRCTRNIINNEIRYISSISFTDIGYKKREKIVGFIFNQQRLLLKKGLR